MSKAIDVTKLQIEGVRASEHVRIPGVVAGVSIRGGEEGGGPRPYIDWEHRCVIHISNGTHTIVPFENVMYITARMPGMKEQQP